MQQFLNIVAQDLMEKTNADFSNITIVFPNKRASLFFNKALQELTDKPLWSPEYTTISQLFRKKSEWEIADRIKLICDLYESYTKITGSTEPLDQFYGWGELMLTDFDDIDKHEADPSKVFTLLGDLHALDSVDYLTEDQQAILQRFFKNFTKDHTTQLKERFLQLWNKFQDIYNDYHDRLASQGIAYEGMLYRHVIETLLSTNPSDIDTDNTRTYIFVGFNLLNTVEQDLFSYFQKQDRAKFYWDYDHYYMNDHAEAGIFIRQYLKYFPDELPVDHPIHSHFTNEKSVTIFSSPTDDLQARYVAEWLTPERIAAGRHTAIVLADESLLETVLHCLPESVKHVNITTGYPLAQTPIATLIRLTTFLYERKTYTLHNINAILRQKLLKNLSPKAAELYDSLNQKVIYYPTLEDLSIDKNLTEFFKPIEHKNDCTEINDRLLWIVTTIAKQTDPDDALTQEALYRMYTILNRLSNLCLKQWSTTLYTRLLQQIVQMTTIPFHGEPIEGIQIMGVLETRNLDFDNLLVLSCNEGNLPAKINDSSFIPHSVRQAYGLTTVENKVAIYAYYFHRLLQRSSDINLIYNNSTNDGHTGEMSRFMLQLIAESTLHITRKALQAGQETHGHTSYEVTKSEAIIRRLTTGKEPGMRPYFSPTALGNYLRCPMRFFYRYIAEISDQTESDEEEMDNITFGNIFHRAAELLYKDKKDRIITKSYLTDIQNERKHPNTIERLVDQAFREELFKLSDDKRKMPKLGGLQVINREMVIRFMKQLIEYDIKQAPFTILGTEEKAFGSMTVNFRGKPLEVAIGGKIDRLDKVVMQDGLTGSQSEHIRIIDYKTGRFTKALNQTSLDDIFNMEKMPDHADYFLQALMYSSIVADPASSIHKKVQSLNTHSSSLTPITPAILYVQQSTKEDYSPLLTFGPPRGAKNPILDATPLLPEYREHIKKLIEDIINPDKPFTKTPDTNQCERCPYAMLCR